MTLPYRPTGERTIGLYFSGRLLMQEWIGVPPRFPEPKAPFYRCCLGCLLGRQPEATVHFLPLCFCNAR